MTGDFDVGLFGAKGGGQSMFIVGGGKATPPVHLAFRAPDRAAVDAFYNAALAAGGRDNGPPGLREHYHANYAAFVFDPDGNNIEAVCHAAPGG
jgi:catechol 2,3-dioxygenase-like lactoylglutathione lyase family enzyme